MIKSNHWILYWDRVSELLSYWVTDEVLELLEWLFATKNVIHPISERLCRLLLVCIWENSIMFSEISLMIYLFILCNHTAKNLHVVSLYVATFYACDCMDICRHVQTLPTKTLETLRHNLLIAKICQFTGASSTSELRLTSHTIDVIIVECGWKIITNGQLCHLLVRRRTFIDIIHYIHL